VFALRTRARQARPDVPASPGSSGPRTQGASWIGRSGSGIDTGSRPRLTAAGGIQARSRSPRPTCRLQTDQNPALRAAYRKTSHNNDGLTLPNATRCLHPRGCIGSRRIIHDESFVRHTLTSYWHEGPVHPNRQRQTTPPDGDLRMRGWRTPRLLHSVMKCITSSLHTRKPCPVVYVGYKPAEV
jgi:hypothetical protein